MIGLFGATTLGENEIGSLSRMGPGYFPLIISTGIILTGLAIAVKSLLLTPALPSEGRIELGRPFSGLLILGSVAPLCRNTPDTWLRALHQLDGDCRLLCTPALSPSRRCYFRGNSHDAFSAAFRGRTWTDRADVADVLLRGGT